MTTLLKLFSSKHINCVTWHESWNKQQLRKLPPLLHQPVSFCVCFSCCSVLCPSFLGRGERGETLAKSHRCWSDYIVETEGAAIILAEIHPERSFCGHVPLRLYPTPPPTPAACWRWNHRTDSQDCKMASLLPVCIKEMKQHCEGNPEHMRGGLYRHLIWLTVTIYATNEKPYAWKMQNISQLNGRIKE